MRKQANNHDKQFTLTLANGIHKSDQKHKMPSTFKCVLRREYHNKEESQYDSPLQQRLNRLRLYSDPKLSTLFFDCYAITAGQTDLSLSSCMLRINDAILFFMKGCHAKVNVRPVMPFQMFFALARSSKGHLTNALKSNE